MHDRNPEDITEDSPETKMEMPRYQSHKKVWALEIKNVEAHPEQGQAGERVTQFRLHFAEKGYASMLAPAEMFSRYVPVPGDFYVVYDDGYKSFSPRKAFLEGYTRL